MAEMETTEPAKLGRGNLRLADVVAQAVGFMGPVFSVTFFLTAIGGASLTGKGAGIAIPISLILAAIGMLGVSWIISRFAKRIHAAGSLYDYVTAAFGRRAGFVAGWIVLRRDDGADAGDRPGVRRLPLADAEHQPRHRHRLVLAGDRLLDRGGRDHGAGRPDLDAPAADPGARLDGRDPGASRST